MLPFLGRKRFPNTKPTMNPVMSLITLSSSKMNRKPTRTHIKMVCFNMVTILHTKQPLEGFTFCLVSKNSSLVGQKFFFNHLIQKKQDFCTCYDNIFVRSSLLFYPLTQVFYRCFKKFLQKKKCTNIDPSKCHYRLHSVT